jgi:hypothetical protein
MNQTHTPSEKSKFRYAPDARKQWADMLPSYPPDNCPKSPDEKKLCLGVTVETCNAALIAQLYKTGEQCVGDIAKGLVKKFVSDKFGPAITAAAEVSINDDETTAKSIEGLKATLLEKLKENLADLKIAGHLASLDRELDHAVVIGFGFHPVPDSEFIWEGSVEDYVACWERQKVHGKVFMPDGNTWVITPKGETFTTAELSEVIDGKIEVVHNRCDCGCKSHMVFFVDEDGVSKKLPINSHASMLAKRTLRGPAILSTPDSIE